MRLRKKVVPTMLKPLNKYPQIDVHGETRNTIYPVIKEFVNDNLKLKNEIIIIVHGKGTGILRSEIHYYLKKMKEVKSYHLDYWNQGLTVVELNV